jgi:hypothetical protein
MPSVAKIRNWGGNNADEDKGLPKANWRTPKRTFDSTGKTAWIAGGSFQYTCPSRAGIYARQTIVPEIAGVGYNGQVFEKDRNLLRVALSKECSSL